MKRPFASICRSQRGAAMVEFAIVLLPLVILIFGALEVGLLMYNRQVITNASREGARYGIVAGMPRKTDGEIEGVVDDYTRTRLFTLGPPGEAAATCTRTGTVRGDDLTVQVLYHYDFLILPNFAAGLVGGTDLVAWTTMKYE